VLSPLSPPLIAHIHRLVSYHACKNTELQRQVNAKLIVVRVPVNLTKIFPYSTSQPAASIYRESFTFPPSSFLLISSAQGWKSIYIDNTGHSLFDHGEWRMIRRLLQMIWSEARLYIYIYIYIYIYDLTGWVVSTLLLSSEQFLVDFPWSRCLFDLEVFNACLSAEDYIYIYMIICYKKSISL